jgi:hypothetical protein
MSEAPLIAIVDDDVSGISRWYPNDEYGDGVHCEVHEGSVRDGYGWKAIPWQPGDPVIDPEAETQRKLLRK